MTLEGFEQVYRALKSIEELVNGISIDSTPIILHHPPSRRAGHTSMLYQNLAFLELLRSEMSNVTRGVSLLTEQLLRQRAVCSSALTPIAALPIELMREVFRLVANDDSSSNIVISSVCSQWRMIALDHSDLWGAIDVGAGCSLNGVAEHYSRSRASPLHIRVDDGRTGWCAELLDALPAREDRLETVDWDSSHNICGFLGTNGSEGDPRYTALTVLRVSFPEHCKACGAWWSTIDHTNPDLEFLHSSVFPALRTLEATRLELGLPQSMISQLEHLKLDSIQMGMDAYRDTLRHACSLKSLIIECGSETQLFFEDDHILSEEIYVLPHLETLKLSFNPSRMTEMMLKNFRYPSLLALHISNVTPWNLSSAPPTHYLTYLGHTLTHAPKLRDLIMTRTNDAEIRFLTTPLQTHAFQLKRLIFSTWGTMAANSFLLPHLNKMLSFRQEAGARPLEIETSKESLPLLQEAVRGLAQLVASTRQDCT
ncbi:hypothetical protein DL93DRAFT_2172818 [Clavulina sp. PMI_390]|nr:hypothetical protein DL93DRAFT_2172818 [Clavulina sp. PMI_390]